jgi:pyruvate/2-oxoglutarate dehydrogenase complex dihydrolipoamide acyltransferase (E2) component
MSSTTKQGTTITMPKLGESVTEGTLGAWLKQVGDYVDKYEPMVEVVTDKVTAEIPAPIAGTIVEIIGQEGETIPVGGVVCVIAQEGGAVEPSAVPVAESPADAAEDRRDAAENATPTLASTPTNGTGRSNAAFDERSARETHDEAELLRQRSSPLVRRLAAEHEINLGDIHGSGMGGRVTKADIMQLIQSGTRPSAPTAAPAPQPQPQLETTPTVTPRMYAPAPPVAQPVAAQSVQLMPGDEVIDASNMRKQIAEHMQRSVQTAPHVTVWMEADMSNIVAARTRHKAAFEAREGFALTYLPFIARVVVQALRDFPNVNAAWNNGQIIRRKAVNLGVAVALEDGLIVPVIKNADERNIVGLARAVNDLATRARANRLQPDEITGGTFTLNNPGTLGSLFSTPIIVQPQAAILSMEAIVKRAVVIDDSIAIRPLMNLSLSLDHRILDGLSGTRFLAAVKQGLESFPADGAIY